MVALLERTLHDKVLAGERISAEEALALCDRPLAELGLLADARRDLAKDRSYDGRGREIVTYIVDRNINYTNVCNVYCKFCAFYRTEKDEDHYVLSREQFDQKLDELTAAGGVQILLQGGHHPKLGFDWYLDLLHHIREKYPHINIHGFSPPEFQHFAETFRMPLREVISRFKEAGLGSIPGGGGEILVDSVCSWPGIGLAFYAALLQRDYPMLQGAFLLLTLSIVIFNYLADLLYFKLDPRISE